MEKFWLSCRKESRLSLRQMSKLLNVRAHTYNAMEQGIIDFDSEIVGMLCLIYKIPNTAIYEKRLLLSIRNEFGQLKEEERFFVAMKNITGEGSYNSNYKKIRQIKDNIRNQIKQS